MTKATIKKYEITYDKAFITELKRIPIYFIKRFKNTKGSYKINLNQKEVNILYIYNQKQKIKTKKLYSKV